MALLEVVVRSAFAMAEGSVIATDRFAVDSNQRRQALLLLVFKRRGGRWLKK